jgi:hypothetical protein
MVYRSVVVLALLAGAAQFAGATPDLKFDVVTFCCPCSPDSHLCQTQFDHLNFPTTNGHYIAMGSDAHRMDLATNGNALAIYYDTFNVGYSTNSGAQQAALIDQYAVNGFTSTGPKPNWVVLNEISAGLWPTSSVYRAWVHDVVHALKTNYGYNVILYSPFSNPGANGADWQAVSADAYIGIENYLSGSEVQAQGFSVSWCQSQYQSSIPSYTNLGVARSRLMLGEEFTQSVAGTGYGRSGVSSNDWDTVITARNKALQNIGFAGSLSYAWGGNAMLASDDELVEHEDVYRTNRLPMNSGITAPFIVIQPQNQTAPESSTVGFNVYCAGIAPTTYQWRFNGTNIAGATTSALSVTNIQPTNGGNYSVVLSNAAGFVISSNGLLSVRIPDPIAFEPFAPAISSYTPGSNLVGQTNAEGRTWLAAGPAGVQPAVQAGSLDVTGLQASSGNSAVFYGGVNGPSARFVLNTNLTSGSAYYSMAIKVTDLGSLGTSGGFLAGFNDSTVTQGTTPTIVAAALQTRKDGSGYDLGIKKASGGSVFDTTAHAVGDTVFVVASYTFVNATTNDDFAQLWINPSASDFGTANPPPPTLTTSGGGDLTNTSVHVSQIASFVLFERGSANASLQPGTTIADELRVGTSWASVTPPAGPQVVPTLNISQQGSSVVLSWTTNATGFTLQAASILATNAWANLGTSPAVVGDQYVVTNGFGNTNTFYRLKK